MLNQCNFIGRLGSDPDTKYTQAGDAVTNFALACSERWKDGNGQKQERTEWVRCVAWRKLGEICGQYLTKGSLIYVSGKMQTRKWEKDGVTMYTTEIVVGEMKMLGGKSDSSARNEEQPPMPDGNDVPF